LYMEKKCQKIVSYPKIGSIDLMGLPTAKHLTTMQVRLDKAPITAI